MSLLQDVPCKYDAPVVFELRSKVSELETQLTEALKDNFSLKGGIRDYQDDVASLTEHVGAAEKEAAEWKKTYYDYRKRAAEVIDALKSRQDDCPNCEQPCLCTETTIQDVLVAHRASNIGTAKVVNGEVTSKDDEEGPRRSQTIKGLIGRKCTDVPAPSSSTQTESRFTHLNRHEEFKRAYNDYPSQDNEGYVPDRGGFKCGFFAAWDLLSSIAPADTQLISKAEFEALRKDNNDLVTALLALHRIADPRKRDHKEPDAYTTLGCVMNIADEAIKTIEGETTRPAFQSEEKK